LRGVLGKVTRPGGVLVLGAWSTAKPEQSTPLLGMLSCGFGDHFTSTVRDPSGGGIRNRDYESGSFGGNEPNIRNEHH
jgi:hypothetical protein